MRGASAERFVPEVHDVVFADGFESSPRRVPNESSTDRVVSCSIEHVPSPAAWLSWCNDSCVSDSIFWARSARSTSRCSACSSSRGTSARSRQRQVFRLHRSTVLSKWSGNPVVARRQWSPHGCACTRHRIPQETFGRSSRPRHPRRRQSPAAHRRSSPSGQATRTCDSSYRAEHARCSSGARRGRNGEVRGELRYAAIRRHGEHPHAPP